jgi:hypothetical protein
MGFLDNIGKGRKSGSETNAPSTKAPKTAAQKSTSPSAAPSAQRSSRPAAGSTAPARSVPRTSSAPPGGKQPKTKVGARLPGKRRRKGVPSSPRERVQAAAAPLHDRRRRLVGARETTLRDLGGLMLEMYKRNRFREELLLDKCEEVLAIEVEIAHVDQRLFQLAPPNAAGMRPIGRCECGASIHPGQNFCGLCGRSFATLTQSRSCARCGSGLRPGDQFCATCGSDAPDALQAIEAPSMSTSTADAPPLDAATIASSAVAETVIIEAPPLTPEAPPEPAGAPAEQPPADVVQAPSPTPAPDPAPSPQPAALKPATPPVESPAGFDWTAPPAAADAAIDAAVDAMPASPTDPETPFAGFPLSSTVPPPPIVDPIDIQLPTTDPKQPAQTVDRPEPVAPAAPTPEADTTVDAGADKAAARAAKKAEGAAQKQQLKEAKSRAKARAKAARAQRKRGGSE